MMRVDAGLPQVLYSGLHGVNHTASAGKAAGPVDTMDKLAPLPDTSGYSMGSASLSDETLQAIWDWQNSSRLDPGTQYVDNTEYARSIVFNVRTHGTQEYDTYTQVQNAYRDHFYNQKGTHDFIYRDVDFLYPAAEHYAQLEDGQDYLLRAVDDYAFLSSMFHFFSGRYGTDEEITQLQMQVDDIVRELAERIKTGGDTSLASLTGTLTIGGAEATLAQVLEAQETARALIQLADTGFLDKRATKPVGDIGTRYAQYGMAAAAANAWGESAGNPLGALLSQAVDRIARVELNAKMDQLGAKGQQELAQLQLAAYEAFAAMDLTSQESAAASLEEGISRYLAQVQNYVDDNPEDTYNKGVAAGADSVLRNSFAQLMDLLQSINGE